MNIPTKFTVASWDFQLLDSSKIESYGSIRSKAAILSQFELRTVYRIPSSGVFRGGGLRVLEHPPQLRQNMATCIADS